MSGEPSGKDAAIEMDDYDGAFARLPALAAEHFHANRDSIGQLFNGIVSPREHHYSRK